jgi:two-component system, NarL family, sensor histidine kinase UhpB
LQFRPPAHRSTLRARLILAISLLALAFCALLLAIQIETTRRAVREEVEAANRITAQLLSRVAQIAGTEGLSALRNFLDGTGRIRANNITLFGPNNEVLYQSPPSHYKQNIEAPDWFAAWVLPDSAPRVVTIAGGRMVIEPEASRAALDGWEDSRDLAGLSAVFILAMVLVVVVVAGRQADRTEHELENSRAVHEWLQTRIESERKHLAQELHDEVAQSVTAIKSLALALPALSSEQSRQAASAIADGATQLYDSMQAIVSRLRPLAIDSLGLSASLQDMVEQASRAPNSPAIELQMSHAEAVPAALRLTVFRIAQEALTNALRHANAKRIRIALLVEHNRIELSINDDGQGLADRAGQSDSGPRGFGLRGMQERAEAVGGKLTLARSIGGGVSLRAELPVAS